VKEKNGTAQKCKTSRLAVAALVVPVIMWGAGICLLELKVSDDSWAIMPLGFSAVFLILFCGPAGVLLGTKALRQIRTSKQKLKGRRLAIEGMIVGVALECVFFAFALAAASAGGR